MAQQLDLYVGNCTKELAQPLVPSSLVPCEMPGCHDAVWCDSTRQPEWTVLKVVCLHCAKDIVDRVAS